jgi:glyoxylate reductase
MKKILVTRKLLDSNEEKLKKLYDVKLNLNDELYSQKKLIEMSQVIF